MKIVQVTYTTSPAFAEENSRNIKAVMDSLKEGEYPGINYNCCLMADHKTFVHTAFFASDEDQKMLNELPAFRHFQQQLKASVPEAAPKQELLTLVGASVAVL